MQVSLLSNTLTVRGWQPFQNFDALPRFIDMKPVIYATYAAESTTTVSTSNFVKVTDSQIGKSDFASTMQLGSVAMALLALAVM